MKNVIWRLTMLKFLKRLLFDEQGSTLAMVYQFSPNTLISSSQMNANMDAIIAVVNALTAENYSADSVGATALNSDVVRAGYGLIQNTDGSLYVDVSDTNPCLELTDGGLRAKVDGLTINRSSSGLVVIPGGIDHGALADLLVDDHTQYLLKTGSIASITTKDHDLLGGLADNDHPQYVRGQSTNYKIDSGTTGACGNQSYQELAVSFNFTFASAPKVIISPNGSYGSLGDYYTLNITTTGFTLATGNNYPVTYNWIAIGTAA